MHNRRQPQQGGPMPRRHSYRHYEGTISGFSSSSSPSSAPSREQGEEGSAREVPQPEESDEGDEVFGNDSRGARGHPIPAEKRKFVKLERDRRGSQPAKDCLR